MAVHGDEHYAALFASIVEGIVRNIPEATSDVMESMSAARRVYVAAQPQPNDPVPLEFDESRLGALPPQHHPSSSAPLTSTTLDARRFNNHITPHAPANSFAETSPFALRPNIRLHPPHRSPRAINTHFPLQFLVDWAAACAKLNPDAAVGGWMVRVARVRTICSTKYEIRRGRQFKIWNARLPWLPPAKSF